MRNCFLVLLAQKCAENRSAAASIAEFQVKGFHPASLGTQTSSQNRGGEGAKKLRC